VNASFVIAGDAPEELVARVLNALWLEAERMLGRYFGGFCHDGPSRLNELANEEFELCPEGQTGEYDGLEWE
jgi:hypothetical protein